MCVSVEGINFASISAIPGAGIRRIMMSECFNFGMRICERFSMPGLNFASISVMWNLNWLRWSF